MVHAERLGPAPVGLIKECVRLVVPTTSREQAGETQRTELRTIQDMSIEGAELRGTMADITLRIVSDQVNLTIAQDGSISAGAEAVTEITDIWTFQRDLAVSDPTWKLVGTRPA